MLGAEEIRAALTCPRCRRAGVIHARRIPTEPGLALRLACGGQDGLEACGVLGVFRPPDPIAWSHISSAGEAVAAIQGFLDAAEMTEGSAVDAIAFAQRKNERIEELERDLRELAQMVHDAYHVGRAPDVSEAVAWDTCPMATCRHAQAALGVLRA